MSEHEEIAEEAEGTDGKAGEAAPIEEDSGEGWESDGDTGIETAIPDEQEGPGESWGGAVDESVKAGIPEDPESWESDFAEEGAAPTELPDVLNADRPLNADKVLVTLNEDPGSILAMNPQEKKRSIEAKLNIPKNSCSNLEDYQFNNLYLAIKILKFYAASTKDDDIDAITRKCEAFLNNCWIYFRALKNTFGYYQKGLKKEEIVLDGKLANLPFGIANVLLHEGYHALAREWTTLEEEVEGRKKQIEFYEHVNNNYGSYVEVAPYLFQPSYGKTPNHIPTRLLGNNVNSLLGKQLSVRLAYSARKMKNGQLIDVILSNPEKGEKSPYAGWLTVEWIMDFWNEFGGIANRDRETIRLYLETFEKVSYSSKEGLSEDEYTFLKSLLNELKKIKPANEWFDKGQASRIARIILNRKGSLSLDKDEKNLRNWLLKL